MRGGGQGGRGAGIDSRMLACIHTIHQRTRAETFTRKRTHTYTHTCRHADMYPCTRTNPHINTSTQLPLHTEDYVLRAVKFSFFLSKIHAAGKQMLQKTQGKLLPSRPDKKLTENDLVSSRSLSRKTTSLLVTERSCNISLSKKNRSLLVK